MATSGGSSVPRIMVFRPTMEEFKNFSGYIEKMESQGAHKAGIAKIIPPEDWCPRKNGYDDIDLAIPAPISQVVTGSQGLFQQINIQQKCMNVNEFKKLAESSKYRTPPHFDYEDLERKYWKNITYNSPIYGADVSGSLYDDGIEEFNIQHLNTILDLVADDYGIKIDGVNTAYLYFGMWKTTFAWHTEDMDLYSINYLHFGAPKSWYAIPPEHGRRLERLAAGFFHGSFQSCPAFLRHKMTIISPQILKKYCIPFNKITQEPGEFMITFPFGYHSGFNHGFNCAESTNFAMPRWVEYGKRALSCTCRNDCVKICMDMFVRKFQPDRYELWKMGKDIGPHPEDPSRHYAAAPPNKAELAIAAQREERRKSKKSDYSQKLKRHPISKISKGEANFQIESLRQTKIESTDKSDSEETEIYDIEEVLKKPKGERKNSRESGKSAPKRKRTVKKVNLNKNNSVSHEASVNEDFTALSVAQSDVSEGQSFDIPPDLKPFWDPEVEKPKLSFSECGTVEKYSPLDSDEKTFAKYSLSLEVAGSGSLPLIASNDLKNITVKNELVSPNSDSFSSVNAFLKDSSLLADKELLSPAVGEKSPKITLEQGLKESVETNLEQTKWKCKQTEHGLKLKIVSPRKMATELCSFSGKMATELCSFSADIEVPQNVANFETVQSSESPAVHHDDCLAPSSENSLRHDSENPANLSFSESVVKNRKSKKAKANSESPEILPHEMVGELKVKKERKKKSDAEGSCSHTSKRKSKRKSAKSVREAAVNWVYPISDLHQNKELNMEAEKQFNTHMTSLEPHCAVCIIFSTLSNHARSPSVQPDVPSSSPVKMPAFCFSKSVDNHCTLDANPLLARDGTSPLLVCASCSVCVHASCYGITHLKLEPWICSRCSVQAEDAKCCLCVLRGGALKPTTDGRWAHIVCATLIEETLFVNVISREPIDVSQVPIRRMSLKCVYCFKSLVSVKDNGSCCVQCKSGRCAVPFHVTCGYLAGVSFECRDWPDPINIVCTRHSSRKTKSVKRQLTEVSVGDKVLAKHKNRRYYWAEVKNKYCQMYYSVLFADNSTSSNLLPEDIVDEHGIQRGLPEIDERVLVKWTDGKIYNSIFKGSRSCDVYVIEFYDGTVTDLERHQFYAADEELPKEVSSRVSTYSDAKGASSHTVEPNSKRIRFTNVKYMSSILLLP